jgi:hypothetical protein
MVIVVGLLNSIFDQFLVFKYQDVQKTQIQNRADTYKADFDCCRNHRRKRSFSEMQFRISGLHSTLSRRDVQIEQNDVYDEYEYINTPQTHTLPHFLTVVVLLNIDRAIKVTSQIPVAIGHVKVQPKHVQIK